ncbi:hypothetical protein FOCC_FOCC015560 [Frankliniella occidentalis]|nr:hypothetical protein FOCC_FOCC015560 [Frankliniella occidentalis]
MNRVSEVAGWLGLKFKPAKCSTLLIAKKPAVMTDFYIGTAPIPILGEGQAYQHLGVPTGFRVDATPRATAERVEEEARKVFGSLLTPWQKLHAIRTFILPQLDFALRTARCLSPPSWGGAGVIPTTDIVDVCAVAHAFQLLTCPDHVVSDLACSGLGVAAKHKLRLGTHPTPADLAAYLNGVGAAPSGLAGTIWTAARSSTIRLKKLVPALQWGFCEEKATFQLHVDGMRQTTIVDGASRSRLTAALRLAVQLHYRSSLFMKPDQGKVARVSAVNSISNHFIFDGRYTRFADWRFIHRARLGVLPLNGCKRWLTEEAARRCRDSAIQRQRPDLVLIDSLNKMVTLVDVTVPFEDGWESFQAARANKVRTYQPACDFLAANGWMATIDAFNVGALGSWDPANWQALRRLRCTDAAYNTTLARLCVSDAIKRSRDIYTEHVTGKRQYADAATPSSPPGLS